MHITDYAKKRYSTKVFDSTRKIDDATLAQVKELLRLSPSSVNGQPWHFIIASSNEGKDRIAKSVQGPLSFNLEKIHDASHVLIFCARTQIGPDYLQKLTDQEEKDGRFLSADAKEEMHEKRSFYVDLHATKLGDLPDWTAKQVYLNLGAFLLGVAAMGLDAVPIEGFDNQVIDEEFDLKSKGLASVTLAAIGYRAGNDFNANLPKSRLPVSEIIEEI